MIDGENLNNLIWSSPIPDLNDAGVFVPDDLVATCPNLIKEGEIDSDLLIEMRPTSYFKRLTEWSRSNLSNVVSSPGFSLVKISNSELDNDRLKSLYYIISRGLGTLNDRYGELFDVKDRNLDYKKEAVPVSKTNASTGFHTDSTSYIYSPDIVGLLCLQPAKTGGESLIVNAANLYRWLKKRFPDSIPILSQDIIRDVITPGSKTDIKAIEKNRFPIFSRQSEQFKFRYMRYWIVSGHERCNRSVPEELTIALDRIDEFLHSEANQISYSMERGDILYINNNFICHNRTGYIDHAEAEKKRTLVRTWINL